MNQELITLLNKLKENTDFSKINELYKYFKKYPDLYKFMLDDYNNQEKYIKISFSDYIRAEYLNMPTFVKIYPKYKNALDFITNHNIVSSQISKVYDNLIKDAFKLIDFEVDNIVELRYCVLNNLKEKPKCKCCGKPVKFHTFTIGYRDFCSTTCQMDYNNTKKEPELSNLSDNEIRDIISKIPADRRNLTNPKIAKVFLNIKKYSEKIDDLKDKERIYLFQNKVTLDDVYCPICKTHKKIFKSQNLGYANTCGRYHCINKFKYPNYVIDETKENEFRSRNRNVVLKNCFIYLLYSEKLNAYKIGISSNPKSRIRKLKNDVPDLKILMCSYVKNACDLEFDLHNKFKYNRVQFEHTFDGYSEFFYFDEKELKYVYDRIEIEQRELLNEDQ
jgi:hypothetical protein